MKEIKKIKLIIKKLMCKNQALCSFLSIFGSKLQRYKYTGLFDYCVKNEKIVDVIKESNSHEVRTLFCNKKGLNELGNFKKGIDYKIYIAQLNNVHVFADSEFIYKNKKILTDRFCYDEYNRYLCPPLVYANKDKALYYDNGKHEKISKGIFLLKYWGCGWFHLTFEVMPRIILIDKYPEFKDYPLLLDEKLFLDQRNVDLINVINKQNRPIIKINRNVEYLVEDLVYPSHMTWLPWDCKQKQLGLSVAIEKSLVMSVRELVLGTLKLEKKFGDKIFITRGNNKRLNNEIETAEYFSKNGFQVINPEDLTFKEEVEMCFFAKAIVCTLGSAVTNVLYANKNVKYVEIGLKELQTEASAALVDSIGIVNYRWYCAEPVKVGNYITDSILHLTKDGMDEIIHYCL